MKGQKTGGRVKGTPNRTTQEARELLERILYAQFDDILDVLRTIKEEDKAKYIVALEKLLQYVMPKKTDVTSGNESIKPSLNITVDKVETGNVLKELRNGKTDKRIS